MKPPSILLFLLFICSFAFPQVVKERTTKNFTIPRYFVANSEAYVLGPFDGDGSNTIIRFENSRTQSFDIKPLMEGSNKIIFKVPDTYGQFELIIADEGSKRALFVPVYLIQAKTFCEDFTGRNKRASLYAKFMGAELIEDEFKFAFSNKSPHIVNIIGGNHQKNKITSAKGSSEVVWRGEMLRITNREDKFSILFTIEQPAPEVEIAALK